MSKVKGISFGTFLVDLLYDIGGSTIFSIGLSCFAAPKEIAPGGVSGIAVMINYLTDIPLGTLTLLMNIPLTILAWIFLGKAFTIKTLKSVFVLSMILNYAMPFVPVYEGDYIIAALLGGVMMGAGLAAVFMRGSTTGGTDIVCRLIQLRYRHVPIGKVMMAVDFVVLASSVLVFHNIEAGLYGLICIYTMDKTIDAILCGLNTGKMVLVISEKEREIGQSIMDEMDRGVTYLKAEGAYSGKEKDMVLCAVRSSEYPRIAEVVKRHDPNAFVIAADTSEILGEGFRYITEEKVT